MFNLCRKLCRTSPGVLSHSGMRTFSSSRSLVVVPPPPPPPPNSSAPNSASSTFHLYGCNVHFGDVHHHHCQSPPPPPPIVPPMFPPTPPHPLWKRMVKWVNWKRVIAIFFQYVLGVMVSYHIYVMTNKGSKRRDKVFNDTAVELVSEITDSVTGVIAKMEEMEGKVGDLTEAVEYTAEAKSWWYWTGPSLELWRTKRKRASSGESKEGLDSDTSSGESKEGLDSDA